MGSMSTVYLSAARSPDRRGTIAAPLRPAVPLCIAGLCVAALALTWVVAALVPATHFKDAVVLHDFILLRTPHLDQVANALVHLLDPGPFIAYALVLIVIALVRRRPAVALAIAAVMGLAPLTSELLKPLLAHPHEWVPWSSVSEASWPSGHATAATALVLCAVLVCPPRLRIPVAALGALYAAAVGCSLLILAWHMPSDVIGGYLIATLWIALALACLRSWDARARSRELVASHRSAGLAVTRAGGVGGVGGVGTGVP
jgi:membrane-associated phospholipid phosphatase